MGPESFVRCIWRDPPRFQGTIFWDTEIPFIEVHGDAPVLKKPSAEPMKKPSAAPMKKPSIALNDLRAAWKLHHSKVYHDSCKSASRRGETDERAKEIARAACEQAKKSYSKTNPGFE